MSNQDTASIEDGNYTIEARHGYRQQLAGDLDAFLASGGRIEEVPKDFRADPPRKPENNYGKGSI